MEVFGIVVSLLVLAAIADAARLRNRVVRIESSVQDLRRQLTERQG